MRSSNPPEGPTETVWCARLRVPAADAEIIEARLAELPELEDAALSSFEHDGGYRQIEIYLGAPPHAAVERVTAAIAGQRVRFEALPETDWLTESRAGLTPIRAGRFYITPDTRDRHGPGRYRLTVGAGLAFGTGHHDTTRGCLLAIDHCLKAEVPRHALDLGCGTGILAMALARTGAGHVVASDNDPAAVAVARENRERNRLPRHRVRVILADGFQHPLLQGRFDTIVANILARPLIKMSCRLARHAAPGGTVILSGVLRTQEKEVLAAYQRGGLVRRQHFRLGEWSTLVLAKPRGFSLGIDRGEID